MASRFNSRIFLDNLGRSLAKAAKRRALPAVKSRTLREFAATVRRSSTTARAVWAVHMPHYWAVFNNDGTRGARAPRGKKIAFFPDKSKDPRTKGGEDYPVRLSKRRKLRMSRSKFRSAIRKKDLILTNKVKGTPAQKFFDNDGGMRGFTEEANKIGSEQMSEAVKLYMGKDLKISETLKMTI